MVVVVFVVKWMGIVFVVCVLLVELFGIWLCLFYFVGLSVGWFVNYFVYVLYFFVVFVKIVGMLVIVMLYGCK